VFDDLATSEDCLYLNIWSPELRPGTPLPVMVYLHGGSNNSGWSYEPNYDGRVLAGDGVVVVSIAYRLGVFGFFSHPALDGKAAVANFGLWDQIAALKWIRQNIRQFGGNPQQVTLFGESSGAQDILALMTSKQARGLFQGAILQSTAGFGIGDTRTLDDEQQRGVQTARLFGFDGPDAFRQLKEVPAEDLLLAYEKKFASYYHSPVRDGQLLERPIWDLIANGGLADIPLIIGTNADEWYSSIAGNPTLDDIQANVRSSVLLNSVNAFAAVREETDYREAMDRLATAENMLCPTQYLARLHNSAHRNTWVYYFSRVRDGKAGAKVRAYHGAELPYVFGTHDAWMTTTDIDRQLSGQMRAYWVQFAKTGNPNGAISPEWPVYSGQGQRIMEFGDQASSGPAPEAVLCSVFRASVDR